MPLLFFLLALSRSGFASAEELLAQVVSQGQTSTFAMAPFGIERFANSEMG
jgi:hypothetical protein